MSHVRHKHLKEMRLFGRNLRALRLEKGITQDELAGKTGISTNSLSRIENGTLNTTLATICELAKVLKVKPHDLVNF